MPISEKAEKRMADALVGEQLSGVAFVADYVEFHFSGPVLRVFTNPVVCTSSERHAGGEPGFRDAFCALIGAWVRDVQVEQGRHIRLVFRDHRDLIVPLDEESARAAGGDAASFQTELTNSWLDVF